jgi:eukaryotic-like serine/threonine-protein kinase
MKACEALSPEFERRIRGRVGETLGEEYRLDRLVGIGSATSVFAATRKDGGRVALKVLHAELSAMKKVRARFLREGYTANRVGHAGAVRVHGDGDDGEGSAFLVMDLLDGATLEAHREQGGERPPLLDVIGWVDQLLDVLAAAHDRGIVHRDLRPEKLFLTRNGDLRVLDFGIAHLASGEKPSAFMAPEQAAGRIGEIDARTDLWSVGATMFTLLSGYPVHDDARAAHARSLAVVVPEIFHEVVSVVDTALRPRQDDRWQTAKAMQKALRIARDRVPGPELDAALAARAALGVADTIPPPPLDDVAKRR